MKIKDMRKIFIMIVIITIASFTLFAFLNFGNDSEKKSDNDSYNPELSVSQKTEEELDEEIKDLGYSDEEIEDMSEKEKDILIMGTEYYYEDDLMRLYSDRENATEWEGDADKLYKRFIEYLGDFKYNEIVTEVKEIIRSYNLTKGDNLKIAAIYADASMMLKYYEVDTENKEVILKGHRDMYALVADVVFAYVRRRESVILDMNSATPVINTGFEMGDCTEIEKDSEDYSYYSQFWNRNLGTIRGMYKIETKFEGAENMYAIVIQAHDGTLRLAGYYGDTARVFMTVGERKDMGIDTGE